MAAAWHILQMQDLTEYSGHDRVIVTLHWEVVGSATSGEPPNEKTVNARIYSSESLEPLGDLDPFTPWGEVTEEQAMGWLHDRLGADRVAEIEANLDTQLQNKLHPTESTGVPW